MAETNNACRFDAVIFDMDGVLVDSEALYLREFRAFSHANGLDVTEEELLAQVGASHQTFQRTIRTSSPATASRPPRPRLPSASTRTGRSRTASATTARS